MLSKCFNFVAQNTTLESVESASKSAHISGVVALKSGGTINTKNAKGYIPLTDCVSCPPRPLKQ